MPLGAVQLDGLRPGRLETALFGTALRGVGLGRDLLPELFVVVGVGIAHVGVDMRREGDPGRPVDGVTAYFMTPSSRRASERKRTVSTATSTPFFSTTLMRRVSTERRMSVSR